MKKLNVAWNNTDWSVVNLSIADRNGAETEGRMTRPDPVDFRLDRPAQNAAPAHEGPSARTEAALQRARREAMALAWATGYPFLVLPCLTEELEHQAVEYARKQEQIQQQTAPLFAQAFRIDSTKVAA